MKKILALLTMLVATTALAAEWSPPKTGSWQCFAAQKFASPAAAADDDPAKAITAGMNQVAKASPVGTVIVVPHGQYGSVVCVKY